MARRFDRSPESLAFVWGYTDTFARALRDGHHAEPDGAMHEARGTVLTWLGTHPLRDDRFEELLRHRLDHGSLPQVKLVCRQLLNAWSDWTIRAWYVERGQRLPDAPDWPPLQPSSVKRHPESHDRNGPDGA